MLYIKIQHQSFCDSGEVDFQEFSPYMDLVAILFSCAKPFEQICNTLSTEGQCEIWWKLLSFREDFKTYTILYMCQWQAQITLKGQTFDYN